MDIGVVFAVLIILVALANGINWVMRRLGLPEPDWAGACLVLIKGIVVAIFKH